MNITLENIGKKYNYNWIFRYVNYELKSSGQYGILGNNGSGKTTLLKVLSGFLLPSEGKITWKLGSADISSSIYQYTGIASPHIELIEEFSLRETLQFHQKFRIFIDNNDAKSLINLSGLHKSADKPLKYFSSGMKQRVKLLLAVMSDNALILLDEPCSNLDEQSIVWYQSIVEKFVGDRMLIVASNDKETECFSCKDFIDIARVGIKGPA